VKTGLVATGCRSAGPAALLLDQVPQFGGVGFVRKIAKIPIRRVVRVLELD
jgi:hypothetical protein